MCIFEHFHSNHDWLDFSESKALQKASTVCIYAKGLHLHGTRVLFPEYN